MEDFNEPNCPQRIKTIILLIILAIVIFSSYSLYGSYVRKKLYAFNYDYASSVYLVDVAMRSDCGATKQVRNDLLNDTVTALKSAKKEKPGAIKLGYLKLLKEQSSQAQECKVEKIVGNERLLSTALSILENSKDNVPLELKNDYDKVVQSLKNENLADYYLNSKTLLNDLSDMNSRFLK